MLGLRVEAAGGTELKTTRTRHIRTGARKRLIWNPRHKNYHTAYRADGNNVDVEAENGGACAKQPALLHLGQQINSSFAS
jgi:flagellar basal body rod protein FlgB